MSSSGQVVWQEMLNDVRQSRDRNYFQLLEVTQEAVERNPDVLKLAYRKQCKRWHPDRNRVSEDATLRATNMFWRIKQAYDTLSNSAARQAHARALA